MRCILTFVLLCGTVTMSVGELLAQGADPAVKEFTLTLHPMESSSPALKHSLLPPWFDRTDANAATIYYRCVVLLEGREGVRAERELWKDVVGWLETPVDKLPQDEALATLRQFGSVLGEVELAARRNKCEWDLSLRENSDDLFGILLPELQALRNIGRLVALRARLEIAEGKHEDAIKTLQTGYAMSRHVARLPLLLGDLVGMAIANMMSDQVLAFVASPNSPNLYWSLTALPRPMFDLRESLELEGVGIYLMFPQLRDAKTKSLTPNQWDTKLDQFLAKCERLFGAIPKVKGLTRENLMDQVDKARAGLVARGYAMDEAHAMSASQVILLHTALTYDELRDEYFRWFYVPFAQSRIGMEKAERSVDAKSKEQEIVPVASLLLPAIGAAQRAVARGQRHVELLQVIEAIRLYAAGNDGKLPSKLSDVRQVPVPLNSMSVEPFGYMLIDGDAILEAMAIGKTPGVRYRLTIAH